MNWYKGSSAGWQDGWDETLGDIQRYAYDAYTARVYITKLANEKITVSASLYHMQNGTCMYQDFWRYGVNEVSLARKTFNEVKAAVEKTIKEFETSDIPNNLLHSYLREHLRYIDLPNKPTCRIPHVDWARENKDGVKDWRVSLYGNRYPKADGF